MRFRGTLILLIVCVGFGVFLYFYEIKGGEQRAKAKETENVIWKVPADDVQQVDIVTASQHITAVRTGDRQWKITAPRTLDADSDAWNSIASSASDISRTDVVEANAADLAPFGLKPPQTTVSIKTKDGKVREILLGVNNPTGTSTYAALQGKKEVFFVSSSVGSAFDKKLDDLRNHAILNFEQSEAQSLDLKSAKGMTDLVKENDRWWNNGAEKWGADTSTVNSLLGDLSSGRLKEYFDGNPDEYTGLGFDKPVVDLRLTVGKDKAIKHLVIGLEKSKLVKKGEKKAAAEAKKPESTAADLYLARDDSRPELFFVDKDFVDKFLKAPGDFRDKMLAIFQRWDIDSITLTNSKGTVNFAKTQAGDWQVGAAKKKAKWDAVNDIFDALEKPVKGFVDTPGPLSKYGLDKPVTQIICKQAGTVKVDCIFGKEDKEGVYAQIKGEPFVKIADKESLDKLNKGESDFVEPPPPPPPAPAATKK